MKKKKYIREGGICQFFDQWSKGRGYIDYQEIIRATIDEKNKRD